MTENYYFFDLDGVLLEPGGYHEALKSSLQRIGKSLGAPRTHLTDEQIAHFEALSITNEWDTLAICTALTLLLVWESDWKIRLGDFTSTPAAVTEVSPDFDQFLSTFPVFETLPGESALQKIIQENPHLRPAQMNYLEKILIYSRDIYRSPILPIHAEAVLGSKLFRETYDLPIQINTQSSLLKYDKPKLNSVKLEVFRTWLTSPNHKVGILTNRPNTAPPGFLSPPEAELGVSIIEMEDFPLLGSGMVAWSAVKEYEVPGHTFLKPNPVHTLGLMQICQGNEPAKAVGLAVGMWRNGSQPEEWKIFDSKRITVFEDSAKGLLSAKRAAEILEIHGINIDLKLIGIANYPVKKAALEGLADQIYMDINEIDWNKL